jgi:LytTr DNA-binding domain
MLLRRLAIEIFIITAIGIVLGLLGPFGTYDMPTVLRFAYWLGFILIGYAVYRPVQTVAIWLAGETAIPIWGALLVAAGLASLPLTAAIGFALGGMRLDSIYLESGFAMLYLQVLGIGIGIQIAMWLLFGPRGPDQPRADAEPRPAPTPLDINAIPLPEQPSAPFFERLPPQLGSNLVCLEMQDHYVCAHTLSGSEMILMRLRDAIAELDGVEGMQVHRSWWVARDQVRAIRREGRAIRLELANGLLAPVSRNRQEALKREGWL